MGSAAAWQLAKRDRDVVLLEQFEQGHVRGGSHGASRVFRYAYPDPQYVRLAQAALPLWRELERDSEVSILDQTGGIDHGDPARLELIADALCECNAPFELLAPEEAQERWSGMRFDRQVLYQHDAGRTNADLTLQALNNVAAKLGAALHFNEGVSAIDPGSDAVVVRTEQAEYCAPVAVVAVGCWAPKLLGESVSLPEIRVTQEQPAHFRPVRLDATWPSFLHYEDIPGLRTGSFGHYGLETPGEGIKVGEHATGLEVDPDDRDFRIEAMRLERLKRYVERWFPGLDPETAEPIACLYDISPKEDFVLDRVGPVVVATGFSGHGFKFTPEIGRMLADLADGTEETLPRFRLP